MSRWRSRSMGRQFALLEQQGRLLQYERREAESRARAGLGPGPERLVFLYPASVPQFLADAAAAGGWDRLLGRPVHPDAEALLGRRGTYVGPRPEVSEAVFGDRVPDVVFEADEP